MQAKVDPKIKDLEEQMNKKKADAEALIIKRGDAEALLSFVL